jgi:hypothetical protein
MSPTAGVRPAVTWRAVGLLAAYLVLFPPLFVLAPLAGLLVASRPATLREWAWIGAAGLWFALSALPPVGLASQVLHAWALFVTAGFVVIMLAGRARPVTAGLTASIFGLGAVTAWSWLIGTGWKDLEVAVARAGWEACRQLLAQASLPPERLAALRDYVDLLGEGVPAAASLLPAMLVLSAIPSLCLAWAWYRRLASQPAGPPAGRFAEFSFSDQMVWLVVASVAASIVPLPDPVQSVAANLALVTAGLYAGRGAAIAWSGIEEFPGLILALMFLGILFILPVALGGFAALGVADTWVNFRQRYAAEATRE